jgi:hypothetical protein
MLPDEETPLVSPPYVSGMLYAAPEVALSFSTVFEEDV